MNKIDKTKLLEWSKEAFRWTLLFVGAWFVGETIKQVGLIPEYFTLKLWVFSYLLPIRAIFILGLTVLSRFIDKFLHAKDVSTPLDLKFVK